MHREDKNRWNNNNKQQRKNNWKLSATIDMVEHATIYATNKFNYFLFFSINSWNLITIRVPSHNLRSPYNAETERETEKRLDIFININNFVIHILISHTLDAFVTLRVCDVVGCYRFPCSRFLWFLTFPTESDWMKSG